MSGKLIHNLKRKRAELTASRNNHTNDCATSDSDDSNDAHLKIPKTEILNGNQSTDNLTHNDVSIPRIVRGNDEFLRDALRKIQELEQELALLDEEDYDSGHHEDDDDSDSFDDNFAANQHNDELLEAEAEALGFAVCAKETLNFLAAEGLTPDNPIVLALRDRLVGKCNGIPLN